MSIWRRDRLTALRVALGSLGVSIFLAFAGFVYEHFSHGVWSYWMVYAFAFPLVLLTLPFLLLAVSRRCRVPGAPSRRCWGAGVACLTAGSLFKGILEIYGTASGLNLVFWVVGGFFLLLGLLLWFIRAGSEESGQKSADEETKKE